MLVKGWKLCYSPSTSTKIFDETIILMKTDGEETTCCFYDAEEISCFIWTGKDLRTPI